VFNLYIKSIVVSLPCKQKQIDMKELRELQATLTNIELGKPVFFNIVQFRDVQRLVKEHGKKSNGFTKWILTEKAKQILNIG